MSWPTARFLPASLPAEAGGTTGPADPCAVDVSDEAVEAMLADSLEHAFADVNERIWTEAKLKSEEMLGAVDSAFALVGEQIEPAEKDEIRRLADGVRAALQSREVGKLKEVSTRLDEATQHLAALVLERALAQGAAATQPPK